MELAVKGAVSDAVGAQVMGVPMDDVNPLPSMSCLKWSESFTRRR